jgi:hypothetical protein
VDIATVARKTQERAKGIRDVLSLREGTSPSRKLPHEIGNLLRAKGPKIDSIRAVDSPKESPYRPGILLDSAWGKAAFALQIGGILLQENINRGMLDRIGASISGYPFVLEPTHEIRQRRSATGLWTSTSSATAQVSPLMLGSDIAQRDILATEPATELTDKKGLKPKRNLRKALIHEEN